MKMMVRWVLLSHLFAVPSWAQINHAVANSVVQIRGLDPQGRMYFGSGVVTEPGTVVTNCHVVRGGGRIVVSRGAETFSVTGERADTHRDLCLLEAPGIADPKARLGAISRLKPGQPLYFYGYPRALGMMFTEGAVKALHPYKGSRIIETSAFFTLGGSGGGLFDRHGKLVGLATFLTQGHSGGYYAIPSDWIREVQAQPAVKIAPLSGLSFWEDALHLPTFLQPPRHK